jgi:hypothetical protein
LGVTLIPRACFIGNGEAKDEFLNNDDDQATMLMMVYLQATTCYSTLQIEMFEFLFFA